MATNVVFVTSTGAYTVPSDFGTLVSVEVIGAGAGGKPASSGAGGEGGGGGAYSSSTAVTGITASGTVYVSTGTGGASGVAGGDTWVNAASNAAPTLTTQGALAKGGAIGASGTGGLGGASASGVGTTKFSGGNGGGSVAGAFGGGGGAAGPSGAGANGGAGNSVNGGGGGGGGSNGGSVGAVGSTTGGDGGNGVGGTGGGLKGNNANGTAGTAGTGAGGGGAQGSTFVGGNGATSAIYTQTSNSATAGPGGGGGGTWYFGTTGGAGGLYGGGGGGAVTGGAGGGGIVVFTYTTAPTTTLATRLSSTGNLFVNGSFDENTSISPSKFRTTANTVYAGTFDEVTGMITTSGLLAYIDAGKLESYPGSGTYVRDLVNPSTNPATLNGTISWVSAGSASYWNIATGAATNYITSTLAQNYLDCTLVFYPDFTYVSGASLASGLGSGLNVDKTMRFSGANGTGPWTLINPDNTDGWASTATTYYVNNIARTGAGSLATGWNIVGGLRTNTAGFAATFAYSWGTGYTGRFYQGRLAAIVLYSRQLTAAEQTNNYNYFASRYGLTPVTKTPVKRDASDGTMYITGIFDENTGAV